MQLPDAFVVSVENLKSLDNGCAIDACAKPPSFFTFLMFFLKNSSMPVSIKLFFLKSECDGDFRLFNSV